MNSHTLLVAHRGDRAGGSENTLAAFEAAAAAGACYLEGDLQLTADGMPVLRHDATTLTWRELQQQEPELLKLSELLAWLPTQPVTFFLELKQELLDHGAPMELLPRLLPQPLLPQMAIISYEPAMLEAASTLWPATQYGWVIDPQRREPAVPLSFVFCEQNELTAAVGRWQASTRIVCYTVNRAADVPALLAKGADLVETDHFTRMRTELSHADASV